MCKFQGGGHVPQFPKAGDVNDDSSSYGSKIIALTHPHTHTYTHPQTDTTENDATFATLSLRGVIEYSGVFRGRGGGF